MKEECIRVIGNVWVFVLIMIVSLGISFYFMDKQKDRRSKKSADKHIVLNRATKAKELALRHSTLLSAYINLTSHWHLSPDHRSITIKDLRLLEQLEELLIKEGVIQPSKSRK